MAIKNKRNDINNTLLDHAKKEERIDSSSVISLLDVLKENLSEREVTVDTEVVSKVLEGYALTVVNLKSENMKMKMEYRDRIIEIIEGNINSIVYGFEKGVNNKFVERTENLPYEELKEEYSRLTEAMNDIKRHKDIFMPDEHKHLDKCLEEYKDKLEYIHFLMLKCIHYGEVINVIECKWKRGF
ncbi:hypothetical protein [Bacillus sp. NPDC060175]|uniref:hypothetical protein n=1 Tax=Bacillus sp. NPDC060175 TaxID=3347061 RepID=UPI00365C7F0F